MEKLGDKRIRKGFEDMKGIKGFPSNIKKFSFLTQCIAATIFQDMDNKDNGKDNKYFYLYIEKTHFMITTFKYVWKKKYLKALKFDEVLPAESIFHF